MDERNGERSAQCETGMDAVYLMSCALHGTAPELSQIGDLDALFDYCEQHSVTAMVAMGLEEAWKVSPPENPAVMSPWKQAKNKAIRKNILLNAERERILAYLDSIGCWYLPLKGSFLQHDYPKFGMRQMSDNDILFDAAMDQQVHDFMVNSGYTVKAFKQNNHDEYIKDPVYNFEMHRKLFTSLAGSQLFNYYENIHTMMVKDDNNHYGYHLKSEDFYVYMMAHAYKHFSKKGTGIRTLADNYVFLDRHRDLDRRYTDQELEKLGLLKYERQCRSLSEKLLGEPRRGIHLTDEEEAFLSKFLGAGTYGSREKMVENTLNKMKESGNDGLLLKLRYIWQRAFPPLEFMAMREPELLEKPWKLPFAYMKRWIRSAFRAPSRVFKEITYLAKYKDSK